MNEKKLSEFRYLNQESQRELIEELNLSVSLFHEMLEMLCLVKMDMEERGRAYGDVYTMVSSLIKKAKI